MMTSDRIYRRQQMAIGIVVLLLAAFSLLQTYHFQKEADRQRECLVQKFTELNAVLDARGRLSGQESDANTRVMLAFSAAAEHPENQQENQVALIAALNNYKVDIQKVREARRANPIPPFPLGVCDAQ